MTLADICLPSWAADPEIAPQYHSALRRLIVQFEESVGTGQQLLDAWHRFEGGRSIVHGDAFRDFWPWYADTRG